LKILKYIICNTNIPVLFSKEIVHDEFSLEVKSAGFLIVSFDVQLNKFKAKCFGESSSLNIKANPLEDEQIIEIYLNEQFFTFNNAG